jgi:hypothetical protein
MTCDGIRVEPLFLKVYDPCKGRHVQEVGDGEPGEQRQPDGHFNTELRGKADTRTKHHDQVEVFIARKNAQLHITVDSLKSYLCPS